MATATDADPAVPDAPPEHAEVVVTGTAQQLTWDLGSVKQPTQSTLTVTGGKFPIAGQFDLGDRLSLVLLGPDGEQLAKVPLVVDDAGGKLHIDGKTGETTDAERRHKARVQK